MAGLTVNETGHTPPHKGVKCSTIKVLTLNLLAASLPGGKFASVKITLSDLSKKKLQLQGYVHEHGYPKHFTELYKIAQLALC